MAGKTETVQGGMQTVDVVRERGDYGEFLRGEYRHNAENPALSEVTLVFRVAPRWKVPTGDKRKGTIMLSLCQPEPKIVTLPEFTSGKYHVPGGRFAITTRIETPDSWTPTTDELKAVVANKLGAAEAQIRKMAGRAGLVIAGAAPSKGGTAL